jgi:type IV pilus assembly protein PilC
MAKHPKVFDGFFVSLVDAGEQSGNLENNLGFLADQTRKDFALKQKVKGAMLYPGLVLGATAVMGTGISWFVLPQLIDLFTSFEVELPLSTKILMGAAFFMRDYGAFAFFGMILVIVSLVLLLRMRHIKKISHRIMLRVPVLGKILSDGQLASFSRNLGTLLKSGIPMLTAFEITTNTLSNLVFVDDLKEIKERIKTGKSIFESMQAGHYDEFDKLTRRMIDVGEKSGNLEEMLIYLSDFYDEDIDGMSKNLTTLLEPALLLTIGIVVGFVAMAIISPIYSLVGGIGG